MDDDWTYLKRELDRVEGRVFDFGTFAGWRVEQVGRVDRRYLLWCLDAVPLRHELRQAILGILDRPAPGRGRWRAGQTRRPWKPAGRSPFTA
jgi:hypothetical protein